VEAGDRVKRISSAGLVLVSILALAAAPPAGLAATVVNAPAPALLAPPVEARLAAVADEAYEREPVGSLTVGVVRDGQLVWTASYGQADIATGARATENTVYRVASVTKQFTALMLLQLVNAGVVKLSDPVARYVPEIRLIKGRRPGDRPMTLMQLATHTSGLAVEADDPGAYTRGPVKGWDRILLAALPHTRYTAPPGEQYAYSNIDYAILALALSRAARTPYVTYVRRHIFAPLGMTHTRFSPPPNLSSLALGYVMRDGLPDGVGPYRELAGRGYKVASGGAFSTVEDLARFVAFQMGYGPESVLPHAALMASRDLIVSVGRPPGDHGVGFQTFQDGDLTLVGHVGGIAGYRSLTAYDPHGNLGVIVLRNVSEGGIDPVTLGRNLFRVARD
jgi:CubicO group peptidase (beta-lactamase class C family)